jgi:hypothetical protein
MIASLIKSQFMPGEKTSGIPSWAKGLLAVAGVIAVGAAAYGIYSWNKNRIANAGANAETGAAGDELKALSAKGVKITRPQSQIDAVANSFFVAMDGYGTNRDAIYEAAAQIRNQADMVAIKKSYGIRELSSGAFNPEPNFKGSLSEALTFKLNKNQKYALNLMLAKKGVSEIV